MVLTTNHIKDFIVEFNNNYLVETFQYNPSTAPQGFPSKD